MEQLWQEIEYLQRKSENPRLKYLSFTDDLPKIDFSEAMNEVRDLIESFGSDRGNALLLVQDNFLKAGDLCLKRIRDELKSKTGDFKPYIVDFNIVESFTEHFWLELLARQVGLEHERELDSLAESVIDKLCNSVRSGSVILLEIHNWDVLPSQKETLASFLEKFWIPFVSRLKNGVQHPRVKFIAVIVVESELSSFCFDAPCLCNPQEDDTYWWSRLTLRDWTQEEIKEWLEIYPGIGNPRSISQAERIFRISKQGVPNLVKQRLQTDLILS
jgi:inactive STAND